MTEKSVQEIQGLLSIQAHEGKDKVTSLREAIARHAKPGMNLYISPEGGAAICELTRQFQGKDPGLVLTVVGTFEHALNLVHCGLVNKLITTNCSNIYPSPSVSRIIQNAYKNKEIAIENWSLYTHLQRLMAGALGLGFVPTRSVIGSTMAEKNHDSFMVMDDPFGAKGKVGVMKALQPDLALVHGWAADRYGNTIGVAISSQASTDHRIWGAKASKKGAIVTVEKIVSTDFIRKYASLVTLPGHLVRAVCEVPYGAHPQGMFSPIPGLFDSYGPDYEFVSEHKEASKDSSEMEAWLQQWVISCRDNREYVKKLGPDRIQHLHHKAKPDYWEKHYQDYLDRALSIEGHSETERMILVAATIIKEIIAKNDYRILLGGIGMGMLASWMAYYMLRRVNYDLDLVVGTGTYGFVPRPGDPFYGTFNNLHSCKAFFDTSDLYGFLISGENKRSISILGAAEIDKHGNLNSTQLKDRYLMGSGGANDAANASEVLVLAKQSKRRFVENVSYITCPGTNVKTVVSHMGVFQKIDDSQELKLVACLPDDEGTYPDTRIQQIKENCGWNLQLSNEVQVYPMPEDNDLFLLRLFDPEGVVLGQ